MCGICGVRRFGPQAIDQGMIDILLLNNQSRGAQATGVALQQIDGSIDVFKKDEPAWEVVASKEYKKFMEQSLKADTVTVLGHTRAATKGSPRNNKNNHPVFAGTTAVTHNGILHNDESMFKDLKLERKAEVDSDILRAILDNSGFTTKSLNTMDKLIGSAAFAAVSTKYPGKLLLARSGNPLELAATENFLIWSSETSPIYKALRPYDYRYGFLMRKMSALDYFMIPMNNHSAWLIGDKPRPGGDQTWMDNWIDWHQEIHISANFTPHCYKPFEEYRGKRMQFYDDKKVDVVRCPNEACGMWLGVAPSQLAQLKLMTCKSCKTKLA